MQNWQSKWTELEPRISDIIEDLAREKREAWSKVIPYGLLWAVPCVLIFSLFAGFNIISLAFSLLFSIGVTYFYYHTKRNEKYKKEVMPKLVDAICPGSVYSAEGSIPRSMIGASQLFSDSSFYKFSDEDNIRGKVDKTDFVYGELEITHTTGSGKNQRTVTDFKGFVFEADFNKNFNGVTLLSSQFLYISSRVGVFSDLKRCHLEDVNFEDKYRTYTTDDQEARYILTPALQQRIMEMNETFRTQLHDSDILMSFYGGRMLIMVPSSTDRFEVKYSTEDVKTDVLALAVMIDIVEMLNLNLRIWSKE